MEQLLELATNENNTVVIKDCEKKINLLFNQIKLYKPTYAVLTCSDSAEKLRQLCKKNRIKTKILCGPKELVYVSSHKDCNCIMSAIVGSAALEPTFHAIKKGKKIFLAN